MPWHMEHVGFTKLLVCGVFSHRHDFSPIASPISPLLASLGAVPIPGGWDW